MKLEIFPVPTVATPTPVQLRLYESHTEGDVMVIAVDTNGEVRYKGNLVSFYADGTMHKHSHINPDLGFQLDANGCIKES